MSSAWYSRKWVVILLHIATWLLLFSLPFLLRPGENSNQNSKQHAPEYFPMVFYATTAVLLIGTFYLNANVLLPKLFLRRKFSYYFISLVALYAVFMVVDLLLFKLLTTLSFTLKNASFNIFPLLFILACSMAYRMIKDKMEADKLLKDKETERVKTELTLLRSQVSPHFMFNVLNNMVALARKQSDQLEPSLIKLSSLMRYMLYEADEQKVPLEKEIEYLQSYIDLQQQRFGKKVAVNVLLNDVDNNYDIEPMLLIPFVENAFKHGTALIENPQIDIVLKARNNVLEFNVRNKYREAPEEVKDKTSGIGLFNVKRRLNLLYDKDHSLEIHKNGEWFTSSLQLKLHS